MPTELPNSSNPAQFAGRVPAQRQARIDRLNMARSADFLLKWHPARWHCVDGEWLPQLGKIRREHGVNGVDRRGDTALAETNATRRGWRIIPMAACPATMTPDGLPGYVRVYDGRSGPVHMTPWELPKQVGGRVILKSNGDGYNEWLRWLVEQGHVWPADPDIIEALTDIQRARLERNQSNSEGDPRQQAKALAEASKLAAMIKGAADLEESGELPIAPAPPPKRRRTKRAAPDA